MNQKARILVVDDDESMLKTVTQVLSIDGYEITPCQSGQDALALVNKSAFDVVLVDMKMPDVDGLEVLKGIKITAPETPVIVITGYASLESAVEAIRQGAYDYLVKACTPEQLKLEVARGLELRAAGQALRESEERYRTILGDIEDGYFEVDIAGSFTFFNDSMCRIIGYPRDEMTGMNNREYMDEENAKRVYEAFNRVYTTGKPRKEFDWEITRKDGTRRFIEASFSLTKNSEGEPSGFRGIARDVTERRQAEEALRRLMDFNESIVQNMGEGIVVVDAEGYITFTNSTIEALLGYEAEELRSQHWTLIVPPDQQPTVEAADQRRARRESDRYELDLVQKDGTRVPVLVSGGPRFAEEGFAGTLAVFTDMTERKRAEEEIQRHLERVGALREIDRAISSTLDLSEVLDIILEQLERVIPHTSAAIFLLTADIAKVTAARGFADVEQAMEVSFPVEEDPLARQVLQERRPLVLADAQADERFQARGGTEYVRSWMGIPLIVRGEAIGFLTIDHREPGVYDEQSAETALALATQAAVAIENAQAYETLKTQNLETISALAAAVEAKDPYTSGHSEKVTQFAVAIAEKMGLSDDEIENLRVAGLLHDIGKIGIPDSVLNKPARLTSAERIMVNSHPVVSAEIVGRIEALARLVPIIRHHHERHDGKGYPDGLKGAGIPLLARILAVADGFEAMTSDRPYRLAMSTQEALATLQEGAAKQWDAEIVQVFCRILNQGSVDDGK